MLGAPPQLAIQPLAEGDVEEDEVAVDELEDEHLVHERVLRVALEPVVLPIIERDGRRLPHHVKDHDHHRVDDRDEEQRVGAPLAQDEAEEHRSQREADTRSDHREQYERGHDLLADSLD